MNEFLEFCQQLMKKSRISIKNLYDSEFAEKFKEIQTKTESVHPRQILYHAVTQDLRVPLCICNKKLPWHADQNKFRRFCSVKCQGIGTTEQRKATNMKKYGVAFPSQKSDYLEKVRDTSQRKWGVDHYAKTAEFHNKVINTNQQNLGVDRPAQNPQIREKIKNTTMRNHSVANPMWSDSIKEKLRQTCQTRYGVSSATQSPEVIQRTKNTNLQRYGVDHLMKLKEHAQLVGIQRKKNYYSPAVFDLVHDKDWLQQQNTLGKSVVEIADQLGVSSSNLSKYYHKHGIVITKHTQSLLEKKLAQHFTDQNISVKTRDCSIIPPKELDIVFTQAKLAIEVNGAYWHSEQFYKDSAYHLKKTQAAQAAGYELWHFWDWELETQWDKIINKITSRISHTTTTGARKLSVHVIDSTEKSQFCNQWHLQNDCTSSVNLGLRDSQNQLLMVATFGASRFNKLYDWELLRLCSKETLTVVGGASKLISHYVNHYMKPSETLVSYCNLRWSNGNVYRKCGFDLRGHSDPSYVYVKAGKYAASRYQFQKHKLSQCLQKFDPELSEKQNTQQNGFYRAWDCGNLVFYLTKK